MKGTPYHYPPELLKVLIDVIPKLCKSKNDLILFFKGAGVSKQILKPHEDLLKNNRNEFNKYHASREILSAINEQGDKSLAARREVIKRVTEFEDFSVCWPNDQAAARGLVVQVRDMVNVKDAFTRMKIEKDEEKRKRIQQQQQTIVYEKEKRRNQIQAVKKELFSLFKEENAQKRGKALENVLNNLFVCYDMSVREAFTIKGKCGEGIIEQIDGLVELEGHLYLVEMKWWNSPIGTAEISPHLVRLFNRGGQTRGLFISYSNYTQPAITTCRDALSGGAAITLSTVKEIVKLLEDEKDLKVWLKTKINAAIIDKEPHIIVE
ncbi:hypothetical protein MettiDRAFT_1000 [Methanolobus tindarius DSM 2278]|uniref:Restriction endonuclease type IV Mrr domain-containing protein n=1 Tax=Methanolobus tindarius DSM 2278 TaxID=1090322 RepID=W9DQ96_METTI|nr:restriction endonuclease [Methanolobus tindarius]ETA67573.1 hypothetical protein MettiDRAFT_1000 [Methanolobus tindarius DSM 2278]